MGVGANFLKALRASPRKAPLQATAAVAAHQGRIGRGNVRLYRNWSRGNTWVRAAINIRNDQIAKSEWDIVPIDSKKRYSVRLQEELRDLFKNPNPVDKDFPTFISKVNEDILVLDAGVVEKDRSLDKRVRQLWADDGGEFKVNALWDGDPDVSRFYWCPGGGEKVEESFLDRDIVYLMANPHTYLPIGIPPLETLKDAVEDLLYGRDYQSRQVRGAAPDGVLDLGEGAGEKALNAFRQYWQAEIAGKGAVGFIGGSKGAKWIPFRGSNNDMQFMEWNVWLVRQVAILYGLSAQRLSLTMDVNRANAEVLDEQDEDTGLKPLQEKIQSKLTTGVVQDESFGGRDNNLMFSFKDLNLKETKKKADINEKALGGAPWKMVDEARKDDGRPPIGGKLGSSLLMKLANGVVALDPEDIPTAREYMELMAKKNDAGAMEDGPAPDEPGGPAKAPKP